MRYITFTKDHEEFKRGDTLNIKKYPYEDERVVSGVAVAGNFIELEVGRTYVFSEEMAYFEFKVLLITNKMYKMQRQDRGSIYYEKKYFRTSHNLIEDITDFVK